MKRLFIISLLFLSVGFGQNTTDEPNPMKGVKTQIKSIYEFEEKFGELKEIQEWKIISKYDSDGNKVEWLEYNSDGSLESKTIYKYDSNGNNVEWSMYDSEGNLTDNVFGVSKTIYKYDSKNRIIESISYDFESKFGELQEIPEGKTIYQYEEY